MSFKEEFKQSPNISSSRIVPTGIILHHTAGSYAGSVAWCLNATSKVSYHCIVDTNGDRTNLAKPNQRAWHAGQSSFKGRSDCNSFMLGIAVSGDTSKRGLTEREVDSVVEWCMTMMREYNIPIGNVTTHRAVSPGRKTDVSPQAEAVLMEALTKRLSSVARPTVVMASAKRVERK